MDYIYKVSILTLLCFGCVCSVNSQTIDNACQKTFTCMTFPEDCSAGSSCVAKVSYRGGLDGKLYFQTAGKPGDYVSIGISLDQKMANTFAIACVVQATGPPELHRFWLTSTIAPSGVITTPDPALLSPTIEVKDGVAHSTFSIQLPFTSNSFEFKQSLETYILFATGKSSSTSPFITFHSNRKSSPPVVWELDPETSISYEDLEGEEQKLQVPLGCTDNCLGSVLYKSGSRASGLIKFKVFTGSGRYNAVAISQNKLMGNAYAIACIATDGGVILRRLWLRNGRIVKVIPDTAYTKYPIIEPKTSSSNGVVECSFGVKLPIEIELVKFNPSRPIHILLADGLPNSTAPYIGRHGSNKRIASESSVWELLPTTGGRDCPNGHYCNDLPVGCKKCDLKVTALPSSIVDAEIEFKLEFGSNDVDKFGAIGISQDQTMTNSFAVACIKKSIGVVIQMYWLGVGREVTPLEPSFTELLNPSSSLSDGIPKCEFTIKLPINYSSFVFDPSNPIFILSSIGLTENTPRLISHHSNRRAAIDSITWVPKEDIVYELSALSKVPPGKNNGCRARTTDSGIVALIVSITYTTLGIFT